MPAPLHRISSGLVLTNPDRSTENLFGLTRFPRLAGNGPPGKGRVTRQTPRQSRPLPPLSERDLWRAYQDPDYQACERCGEAIAYMVERHAWVHVIPGADHPPEVAR
jgi:hypothetical protein